jgi:beta-lactamase class A
MNTISRLTLFSATLILITIIAGCSKAASPRNQISLALATESGQSQKDKDLETEIKRIALDAQGRVGVAAQIIETGETVSLNSQDHFPMQSVYKLPICMALMKQIDAGKISLDQRVRVTANDFISSGQYSPIRDQNPKGTEISVAELMRYAISESDGTASDVLMRLAGGPKAVQTYLTELKISGMMIFNTEKELGGDYSLQYRNWSSPEAAVALLRALNERRGLSEPGQALLLKLLTESTPGSKRLKGLLPANTPAAHKTGSSGSRNGVAAATNDIGIITLPDGSHLAIAVFVSDAAANDETRDRVIARIAKAAWDRFGSK